MSVERVAEVLDAHHINIFGPTTMDGFECTCGAWVAQAHLAAHQAEMLRAEGLVPERIAWVYGVQYGPDSFYVCPSRESALSELAMRRDLATNEMRPHMRLVRTPVYPDRSPWLPADEDNPA